MSLETAPIKHGSCEISKGYGLFLFCLFSESHETLICGKSIPFQAFFSPHEW